MEKVPTIKPLLLDDQGREVDEHGNVVPRGSKRPKRVRLPQWAPHETHTFFTQAALAPEPVLHIEKASATPVLDAAPTLSTVTYALNNKVAYCIVVPYIS